MPYLKVGLFPAYAPADLAVAFSGKLRLAVWPELVETRKVKSLRQLAATYGVPLETIGPALLNA
jgi:hypothetical protein